MNSHTAQSPQGNLCAQSQKLAYTVDGLADALDMGPSTIYKLLGEGKLKAVKYGRKTMILAESARDFLASLEREAA